MSAEQRKLLNYIIVCVSEFAERYHLPMSDAYRYLQQYKGIDFLTEFYDIEHTLSFADAVEDLSKICVRNGGALQ